jgi:protein-disulfide isomerase
MNWFGRKVMVAVCAGGLALAGAQTAAKKDAAAKKPVAAKPAAAVKSAFDKATFEAYMRHLFVWNKKIEVSISDPMPSKQLPGFEEVVVHAAMGQASQDEIFFVSKDGQKILRAMVFDVNQNPFKPDLVKLKTEFQPSMGTPNAPVVIVVFTDFQCPYCKEEAKMLRQNLLSAYPKQVRLYFKDFPLAQIHPWAKEASIAGRCIFRQNPAGFWEYHDWIYEHQQEMTAETFRGKLLEWAKGKEIDTIQLTRCLDTRATEGEVDKNIAEGRALQVRSTPTMFINGRRLEGQVPWPSLRDIIDYEIEYQKTAKNAGEDCGCEVSLPSAAGPLGPASTLGK